MDRNQLNNLTTPDLIDRFQMQRANAEQLDRMARDAKRELADICSILFQSRDMKEGYYIHGGKQVRIQVVSGHIRISEPEFIELT